jgi:uncharacterized membrane protein
MITLKATTFLAPVFTDGFLYDKESIFNTYKWPLYLHAFSAPMALLIGIIQFSTKPKNVHRWLGRVYIIAILLVAAPSGFYMAFYAIGGWVSSISFWLLSILWWWFTFRAFRFAKAKDFKAHKRFMIRSFILTNSAIALRLLGFLNLKFLHFDLVSAYTIISWLSWLPFLLVYETINLIQKTNSHNTPTS